MNYESFAYRIERGEIMLLASDSHWISLRNRVHQSKEPIFRSFASCIVPFASPLLVGILMI